MNSIRKKLLNIKEEFRNCKFMDLKGYGFEKSCPIELNSISQIYDFIKRLGISGKQDNEYFIAEFVKTNTFYDINPSRPVDHFEIIFAVIRNGFVTNELYDMYFCGYPKEQTNKQLLFQFKYSNVKIPKGFKLKLD